MINKYNIESKKVLLEKTIYSMSDPERVKTVVTMCEGLEVVVENNKIIITGKPGSINDVQLQKMWDECWNAIKNSSFEVANKDESSS